MTGIAETRVDPKHLVDGPPREMAIVGMHALVLPTLLRAAPPRREGGRPARVLDVGAGQGALALALRDAGYEVSACDMYPELFKAPGIECRRVDAHGALPYDDASFDLVTAYEVVEHLESHRGLFAEVSRTLRPGGLFVFTTPNIMSLQSRLRFLTTGCFYMHGPLDPNEFDPVSQHISAFTPDRYRFILAGAGLALETIACDRMQRSSRALGFLTPLIRWKARRKHGRAPGLEMNNCDAALYGRIMVGIARKEPGPASARA